jgi:hypothetical protein
VRPCRFEKWLGEQYRDWNAKKDRNYHPGFLEWQRLKAGHPPTWACPADQPLEVAQVIDHLVSVYGWHDKGIVSTVHEIAKTLFLRDMAGGG